jgi:hypothetical protein
LVARLFDQSQSDSATAGLVPNEVTVTVHLPVTIGADLNVIKTAARERATLDLERLMSSLALERSVYVENGASKQNTGTSNASTSNISRSTPFERRIVREERKL